MAGNFAYAPLAFSIAIRLTFRGYAAQQDVQSVQLGTQHRKNFCFAHLRDIAVMVRSVFRFVWLSGYHEILHLICVITRSETCAQVRPVMYLYVYRTPGAIALFVRGFVAETINLSQIVDDLIVDAIQVADLAAGVIGPAAFLGQ